MGKLTVAKVKSLNAPGRYADGGTLYLHIGPTGSKSWTQRLVVQGVRRDLGLGSVRFVTLREAREQAFANQKTARLGGDPRADRRRARIPTFEEAAKATIAANRGGWRAAETTAKKWARVLETYVMPVFGSKPVDQVGRDDVLGVLVPLMSAKPEAGRKARQYIRGVLAHAMAHGHVSQNVAGEVVDAALPAAPAVRRHHRAVPYDAVGASLTVIESSGAGEAVKSALRFIALVACRASEARLAKWEEVDVEAGEWRIPADRAKNGVEHRVPLSAPALHVIERMRPFRRSAGWLFPSPARPGRPLSESTLRTAVTDMGLGESGTIHGLRASFRTWASEKTDADHAIMELCLGHTVGDQTERAYARSDLYAKRRALMTAWADYIT